MPFNAGLLHVATVALMVVFFVWLFARTSAAPVRAGVATLVVLVVWLAYAAIFALTGVTLRVDTLPPGGFAVLGPALVGLFAIFFALRRQSAGPVLAAMPLGALHWGQTFRLPVEIVLAMLADARLLPYLMTYHGTNFDILTGITAPFAALAAVRGWRRTALAWNWLGLALVLNIALTSIVSFSGPTNLTGVTPPADFAMTFPMVWLPAFLVPAAILLHLLAIVRLSRSVT
jgi:hypothetical protein